MGQNPKTHCGKGHNQAEIKQKQTDDAERGSDDSDDELICLDSNEEWAKAPKRAQATAAAFPVEVVSAFLTEAGIKDNKQKIRDKNQGQHGIRPGNATDRCRICFWFVESSARPIDSKILCIIKLDFNTKFPTVAKVSAFLFRELLDRSTCLKYGDHPYHTPSRHWLVIHIILDESSVV